MNGSALLAKRLPEGEGRRCSVAYLLCINGFVYYNKGERERNMVKLPIEISTTASNKSNSSSRRNYYYIQHALVFCWWSNKSLCSFVPINTTGTSLHIRSLFIGKCAYVACFLQQQLSCSEGRRKIPFDLLPLPYFAAAAARFPNRNHLQAKLSDEDNGSLLNELLISGLNQIYSAAPARSLSSRQRRK